MQAALARGRVRRLAVLPGAGGLDRLIAEAAGAGIPLLRLGRAELDRLAGGDAQGCAAWVDPLPSVDLDDRLAAIDPRAPALLVACDHLQDPRNLGAIARTAAAVGAGGLIIPDRRAAGLGAGAERTAAGALQALPCILVHNLTWALDRCRATGFWCYGAAADGALDYAEADFAPRTVLVLGAEGRGLAPLVRRHCDALVRLPMRGGVQSLNAAVAAGILMYEWVRQAGAEGLAH